MTDARLKVLVAPGRYRLATTVEAAAMRAAMPRVDRSPCVHLGDATGDLVPCAEGCKGTRLKTFACAVHGSCTLEKHAVDSSVHRCKGCRDYQAPDCVHGQPVGLRHVVCHLLPVSGNGVWQRTVDALRLRWSLFTGRKVVSVATGSPFARDGKGTTLTLDPPNAVRGYLPPDCEVIETPNDPARWEMASWAGLWERVLDGADPLDAVLYCHTKGASRSAGPDSPYRAWADLLAVLSLDHWPALESELRCYPLAGSMRKVGYRFSPPMQESKWHYSGNWFWARAGDIRQRLRTTPMPADRWAAEAWLGIAYRPDEAGTVFQPELGFDLFKPDQMVRVLGDYHRWMTNHPPRTAINTAPLLAGQLGLSIIIPTVGRPSLSRTLASITGQLLPGDELIVECDASRDWGMTPRTRAMRVATGKYLLFQDDDDDTLPGALAAIRAALAEAPGRPHVFRMRRGAPYHDVLPYRREVKVGQVSTQMFVCPNDPARLGQWSPRYEGDFDYISSTLALYPPDALVWRDEVIAHWRPD